MSDAEGGGRSRFNGQPGIIEEFKEDLYLVCLDE